MPYVAVRYVDGLLDVSPGLTAEVVETGLLLLLLLMLLLLLLLLLMLLLLLLLLLQLQRLDLCL